jgi:hypothetical protein
LSSHPKSAAAAAAQRTQAGHQREHSAHQDSKARHDQAAGEDPCQHADHAAGGDRSKLAAENACCDAPGDRHGKKEEHRQVGPFKTVAAAGAAPLFRLGQVFAADQRDELVGRGIQPTGIVTLLEARRDGGVDHLARRQVGDCAFQRLGGFDADFAVVLGHHQQKAVAYAFAPDLPGVAHALRIGGDVFRLGGRHDEHHDLRPAALLKGRELGFQRAALRGIQRACAVHDVRRERGHGCTLCAQAASGNQAGQQQRQHPAGAAAARQKNRNGCTARPGAAYFLLKSTTGGVEICASLATVKFGLTW